MDGSGSAAVGGTGQPLLEPMLFSRKQRESAQRRIAGLRAVAFQVGAKGIDETRLKCGTSARCTSERSSVSIEDRNRAEPGAFDP